MSNELLKVENLNELQTRDFFKTYYDLKTQKEIIDETLKRVQGKIEQIFIDNGCLTKIETPNGKITYTIGKETIKEKFDVERFKADFPDLYEQYVTREYTFTPNRITITPSKEIKESKNE